MGCGEKIKKSTQKQKNILEKEKTCNKIFYMSFCLLRKDIICDVCFTIQSGLVTLKSSSKRSASLFAGLLSISSSLPLGGYSSNDTGERGEPGECGELSSSLKTYSFSPIRLLPSGDWSVSGYLGESLSFVSSVMYVDTFVETSLSLDLSDFK